MTTTSVTTRAGKDAIVRAQFQHVIIDVLNDAPTLDLSSIAKSLEKFYDDSHMGHNMENLLSLSPTDVTWRPI